MDFIYGETNKQTIQKEYQGKDTETAKVIVDNENNTISVDVIGGGSSGFIIVNGANITVEKQQLFNPVMETYRDAYACTVTNQDIEENKTILLYPLTQLANEILSYEDTIIKGDGTTQGISPIKVNNGSFIFYLKPSVDEYTIAIIDGHLNPLMKFAYSII